MNNYKQLSKELYGTLKELRELIDAEPVRKWSSTMSHVDAMIERYETEVVRSTGRTTALYHKSIAEALANPGERVEFVDHSPINFANALSHQNTLRSIIAKLGYDIEVFIVSNIEENRNKVILINKFLK